MIIRILWILFLILWTISTFILVIPFVYWVIAGRNWIDPEKIYNKLFEDAQKR